MRQASLLLALAAAVAGCQSAPAPPPGSVGDALVGEHGMAYFFARGGRPVCVIVLDTADGIRGGHSSMETSGLGSIGLPRTQTYSLQLTTAAGQPLTAQWSSKDEARITVNGTVYDLGDGRIFLCPNAGAGAPVRQVSGALDEHLDPAAAVRRAAEANDTIKAFLSGEKPSGAIAL